MSDFVKLNLNNPINKTEGSQKIEKESSAISGVPEQKPQGNEVLNHFYNIIPLSKKNYLNDKQMYAKVYNVLDDQGKKDLEKLLRSGKLMSTKSNDGSSTLENLYKVITKPRLPEFDSKNIVATAVKTLAHPFLITQNFGDIPDEMLPELLKQENIKAKLRPIDEIEKQFLGDDYKQEPLTVEDIDFSHGHSCAAASIEFNLADKKPAEFVRIVEGLTSPAKESSVKIKYRNVAMNMNDAIAFLQQQKADFEPVDWEHINVKLKPDDNAYFRANLQEDRRIKDSRSMIDVLMQSTFMQLGSRQTYNTITDIRSADTGGGRGLAQEEIAFVESLVDEGGGKIPLVYMELDDDVTKILNYAYSAEKTQQHITDSIDSGSNVILGFLTNTNGRDILTPDGHEISICGYNKDKNGELYFIYNDTDDGNYFEPSYIYAKDLIPVIHHANIPMNVLDEEIPNEEMGYIYLQEYKKLKEEQKNPETAEQQS